MKTQELTELGLTEEQVNKIFVLNGKDVESVRTSKDKEIASLMTERDDLKTRLTSAEETLKNFDGIDPQKIQQELQDYKKKAEEAERDYAAKILQRDQQDWIRAKLDEYGVTSPYARKALTADLMDSASGLTWKEGAFFGFDEYMKAAKEKDKSLYQTAEEKEAAKKAAEAEKGAPRFIGAGTGESSGEDKGKKTYIPPKIF